MKWESIRWMMGHPLSLRAPHDRNDAYISFEGPCIVLSREESRFRLIFTLTLTEKGHFSLFFSCYFWLIFGNEVDPPDQTSNPTCQRKFIYFIWRPLHRSLTGGVSFRISIQPHTHEKGPFPHLFSGYFRLFSAVEHHLNRTDSEPRMSNSMYLTYLKALA